jgi:hypothetical protein
MATKMMFSMDHTRWREHTKHGVPSKKKHTKHGKQVRATPRDSISFLDTRNRNFGKKLPSNSLSKWLCKYSHILDFSLTKNRRRE